MNRKRISGGRMLWTSLVILLLAGTGPFTPAGYSQINDEQAVVMIGDLTDSNGDVCPLIAILTELTAAEAQRDFNKAGYLVSRIDRANKQDFIDAAQTAGALWFLGHGGYQGTSGQLGARITTDPVPALKFHDGWLFASDVMDPNDVVFEFTLHACGQAL